MPMLIRNRVQQGVVVFDIEGEIRRTEAVEKSLHEAVKEELERGRSDVVLNFRRVPFVDSFGIGELLASYSSVQNMGGRFKLAEVPAKIRLILEITKLTTVLELFDSVDAAVASIRNA